MRDSWEVYFIKMAISASSRANCPRLHVGCVIATQDNQVVATGYNGSVRKTKSCDDVGCLIINNHCQRTIHGEVNAILQCAKQGKSCDGCYAYITHYPCFNCAKSLANSGIKVIYYHKDYKNDPNVEVLLSEIGIPIKKVTIDENESN